MRLQRVISNLLSNAIKFTDIGCIVLHVRCDGDYLVIACGIPASVFRQRGGSPVRSLLPWGTGVQRNFQGTGLGLAICEKLISMMDGDISVDLAPWGSQFIAHPALWRAIPCEKEREATRRNLLLAGGAQYFVLFLLETSPRA